MKSNIGSKISVCLLTFNHVDLIKSTVESILEQTLTDYEIIISDDCSNDGSWEILLELAAKNSNIRCIQTPHNMGMAGNANYAVSHSSRAYIALLHHDDICRNDLLEKWVVILEQYSDIAFVFNPYGVYDSNQIHSEPVPAGRVDGIWLLESYLLPRWGCVVRGTAMIRRSAWEVVGGMRVQFGLLADVDLWMRFSRSWAVGYVAEPIILLRQQRPSYYPEIYSSKHWSWHRQRLLYEIHATNRQEYYKLNTLIGRFKWWVFRTKLSLDTAKWLIYAVIRRKWHMIATSTESITSYDQLWLRALRWGICVIFSRLK